MRVCYLHTQVAHEIRIPEMTEKGSPRLGVFSTPKCAKFFPLAKSDDPIVHGDFEYQIYPPSSALGPQAGSLSPEDASAELSKRPSQPSQIPFPHKVECCCDEGDSEGATGSESLLAAESPNTPGEAMIVPENADEDEEPDCDKISPQFNDRSCGRLSSIDNQELDWEDEIQGFATYSQSPEIDHRDEFGPWSPPPEPCRPPNPYVEGRDLEIRAHKASPPFGEDYPDYSGVRDYASQRDLRTKTLVELCLEHPPMDGETAWETPPRNLQIIRHIRVGNNSGAQVVICHLDHDDHEYAAKIYDPLYYGFSDRIWPGTPRDVADEADKDYCREVAAYLEINDQFGGKEIPKYYGSWTFQIPLDLPDTRRVRDVRLILMEYIEGDTMSEIDPLIYPEGARLGAIARVMEAFSRITFAGVLHGDIAQRNVMVCRGAAGNTIDRVVLIDFNYAVVTRLDNFELLYDYRPKPAEKPANPMSLWDSGSLYSTFGDWFPASWKMMPTPLCEWLFQLWGKSEEFLPPDECSNWDWAED